MGPCHPARPTAEAFGEAERRLQVPSVVVGWMGGPCAVLKCGPIWLSRTLLVLIGHAFRVYTPRCDIPVQELFLLTAIDGDSIRIGLSYYHAREAP